MAHVGVERLSPGYGKDDGPQRHKGLPAGELEETNSIAWVESGKHAGVLDDLSKAQEAKGREPASITGPKSLPTRAVPRLWTRKRASSTRAAIGTT